VLLVTTTGIQYLGSMHLNGLANDRQRLMMNDNTMSTCPSEAPDYVSLEGYVDANVLIAGLQRNGPQLDTEKLVGTFENLRDLDIGLGTPVIFSRSDHQGVHRVWGTQLDETGHYQPIDLQ
jgi:ABC-type branched-subunit amino acid transport system substrate-binding protein